MFNKAVIVERIRSKRFWISLLLGQFLALCISTTNITTGTMAQKFELNVPAMQSFVNYILLFIIYNLVLIYKFGIRHYKTMFLKRGLWYLLLGFFDVEGNYFVVKGFGNTTYLSAMLLNACSTPGVVLLSFLFLKTRYRWQHLIGVFFCLVGLVLLVVSDVLSGMDYEANNLWLGNVYCIIGACFYACSNTLQEYMLRENSNVEIIANIGLFGMIISGIQLAIFERTEFANAHWEPATIGLYSGFTIAMFSLYSLTPVLIRLSGATFFNISLLTSDFYGLILGLIFLSPKMHPMYPFAFIAVVLGLFIYNWFPTLSPQSKANENENENNSIKPSNEESDDSISKDLNKAWEVEDGVKNSNS